MGWSFYCDPSRVRNHAEEKAEIARICSHEDDDMKNEPLQLSKVGSTWYAAVKTTPKGDYSLGDTQFVHDEDGSYVFAAVLLVSYQEGCFGYKPMEETMGPTEARAPKSLIKKLSPLQKPKDEDDSRHWAQRWRERCLAYASIPSYQTGDVIELGQPITLHNGRELKKLRQAEAIYRGRKYKYFICEETGGEYRLQKGYFAGSKKVSSSFADQSPVLAEFEQKRAG